MAKIVRLQTKQKRSDAVTLTEAADALRELPEQLVMELPGIVRLAISRAVHGLNRHARGDIAGGLWPGGFVMLSRNQTKAVWDAIRLLPSVDRPMLVRDAFMVLMLNVRQDTGECILSRDEIAEEIGCAPNHISRIMSTLERMGVISRNRTRIEGMRGAGLVRYSVNPHVAWNGSLDLRKQEAATVAPPLLTLMQGGPSGADQ